MGTVGVNSRTVVHQGSGGYSIAPNDACLTPPGKIPVCYVNLAFSAHASDEATTVYADGHRVMIRTSCFAMSVGDEPGILGGIISGTFIGKASFANFSFDVSIEGEPVPRAFDPMFQNHGSPYNAFSPVLVQAALALSGWEIVCMAVCACNAIEMKMLCFRAVMAEFRLGMGPSGFGPVWDPYLPGVYIEVPYYEGPPPGVYYSNVYSKRHVDENGNPLLLPAPERPPPPGSSRPDVVIVKDPTKPPEPGNIREVYEVKFPGDDVDPNDDQLERYERVTGVPPGVVTPAACGCGNKEEREKKKDGKGVEEPVPHPLPFPKFGPLQEPKKQPQQRPQRPAQEPKKKPWSPLDPPWEKPLPVPDLTPREILLLVGILGLLAMGAVPIPA